jgi:hypothetical protein
MRSAFSADATPDPAWSKTLAADAAAAALLALCVIGASTPAWAQSATDFDRLGASSAEVEGIAASGAREPALIDALTAMSEEYQSEGEYVRAAAAIARALEIARINYGLYSVEQIPLVRQLMENELAMGDDRAVWEGEQLLIELARRNLDDLRAVPILTEAAAKRIAILERHLVGEYPPEIVFGCYYRRKGSAYGSCSSGSLHVASEVLVLEVLGYYDDAIDVLVRNGRGASAERLAVERAALRTVFAFADRIFPPIKYQLGKRYLERIVHYHSERADLLAELEALVQLGDWELLYANHSGARDLYASAYGRLVAEGASRESIDAIFAPELPVVIPASEPNWLDSGAPRSAAFVDVRFEINRYGRGKRIEFLDSSTSVSKAERSRLERMIATGRFRPRTTDGRFEGDSRVLVRHYVDD